MIKAIKSHTDITAEDVAYWGSGGILTNHCNGWFAEVLRGEYSVEEARADCLSVINSEGYRSIVND